MMQSILTNYMYITEANNYRSSIQQSVLNTTEYKKL